jgi:Ca2+-binding EF-hand superfamily protein
MQLKVNHKYVLFVLSDFDWGGLSIRTGNDNVDFNEFMSIMTAKMTEPDTKEEIDKSWDLLKDGYA